MQTSDRRLRTWQIITLTTLFVGYTGYYVCRSNLSVCSEEIIEEFKEQGFNEGNSTGQIASIGLFCYAVGKFTNGPLADLFGGRRVFLTAMSISAICTAIFGFGRGLPVFIAAFAVNRFVQSAGWGSLLQIAMRWFSRKTLATVMGVLTMSYLFGDSVAKMYLGLVLKAGFGWRGVFFVAAATLGIIAVASFFLLKASPRDLGLPEQQVDEQVHKLPTERRSLRALLVPLVTNPLFWIVCTMSIGLTFIRELFNLWSPTYLKKVCGLSVDDAAIVSGIFPFVGALAALGAGWLSDRLRGRHGRIVVPALAGMTALLALLTFVPMGGRPMLAAGLISGVFFFMMAPYTFLSGIMSMELGGKDGSSTAASIIDGLGYFAAVWSGAGVGSLVVRVKETRGEVAAWAVVMGIMAATALATIVVGVFYWRMQERALKPETLNGN